MLVTNIFSFSHNVFQVQSPSFHPHFFCCLLQKHVRKVVGGFGKKSYVSTGVRKPGNTCVTDRHDMTLAVKVALNPNTTNQLLLSAFILSIRASLVFTMWTRVEEYFDSANPGLDNMTRAVSS